MIATRVIGLILLVLAAAPLAAATPAGLNTAGLAALQRADYPGALTAFAALEELLKRSGSEGTKDYSTALHNLGVVHRALGHLEKSLDFFQKCYELRVRLLGRRHLDVAGVLENLGHTQLRLGDLMSAEKSFEESLSQFRRFHGDTHARVANGWKNLGVVLLEMGDFPRAREHLERSLAVGIAAGEPVIETCRTRFNLGELNRVEGDRAAAEDVWLATLAVAERNAIDEVIAAVCDGLGALCTDDGRFAEAEAHLDRALEIRRKMRSKTFEANTMMLRGELALRAGRYDVGRSMFSQSADAMRSEHGARSPRVARIECSRGELELAAGETASAVAAYRRALDEMQIGDVSWRIDSRQIRPLFYSSFAAGGLTRCFDRLGQEDERLAMFELTLDLYARYRRALSVVGRERGDAFLDTAVPYMLALVVRRSANEGLDGDRVCRLADMANALTFLERMSAARVDFAGVLPRPLQIEEDRIRERLARPAERTGAASALELAEAEGELEAFADRLHRDHPRLAALRYPRPATLASVQSVVASDEVVVSYLVAPVRSWALAIGPDTFSLHILPGEQAIAEEVAALRQALRDGKDAAGPLRRLHEILIDPVPFVRSAKRAAFIASGVLEGVPFEALMATGGEFLGDRVTISYQPSLAIMRLLRISDRTDTREARPSSGLLALGNPVYDTGAFGGLAREGTTRTALRYSDSLRARWTPLPGTAVEVRAIAGVFRADEKNVLLGADATEKRLSESDWTRYRYLHFACHGALEDGPGRAPALVLGISGNAPPYDGFLMIDEIVARQNSARVAVLSACQTGLSSPRIPRNGVASLARAFLLSGSDAVVVSLWPVSDLAAARFMATFYRVLVERGQSPGEALRIARREIRSDPRWEHPAFWAPFVLVGLDR
jgi:CHAT domain-containing protein/Flp pilus assembly protein TadD